MAQPGKGGHASAPVAKPQDAQKIKPSGGEVQFGMKPGGTKGTGKGAK